MSHDPSFSNNSIQEVLGRRPVIPPKPFVDASRLAPGNAFFAPTPIRSYEEIKAQAGPTDDPDNYTDPPTFLSHLQRNPRLQPYDFWPLVADSTVIVQHLASVTIFVCCFVAIYREQVSPVSIVSLGSAGTILGWAFWDYWVGQAELMRSAFKPGTVSNSQIHGQAAHVAEEQAMGKDESRPPSQGSEPAGLGLTLTSSNLARANGDLSLESLGREPIMPSAHPSSSSSLMEERDATTSYKTESKHHRPRITLSPRNQQRLATAKSAVLIYCGLLGLSPILKSLTMSTSKDSIWAISAWLMCINILFFDYGGGVGVK
ncbi:MAG: hypothetical protein Q9222_006307 [Ikaeria aurantiellina]